MSRRLLPVALALVMTAGCGPREEEDRAVLRDDLLKALDLRLARNRHAAADASGFRSMIDQMSVKLRASTVLSADEADELDAHVGYGSGEPPVLTLSGTSGRRRAVETLQTLARMKPGLVLAHVEIGSSKWAASVRARPQAAYDWKGWVQDEMLPLQDGVLLFCFSTCRKQRAQVFGMQEEIRALEATLGGDARRKTDLSAILGEMDRLSNAAVLVAELFGSETPVFETGEIRAHGWGELQVTGTYSTAAALVETPDVRLRDPFERVVQ